MKRAEQENFLVCVGPSPSSEFLVYETQKLSQALGAEWTALHVQTESLTPGERDRVERHLKLAHDLGGRVEQVKASSVLATVLDVAAKFNVTKIVVGRTPRTRWSFLARTLEEQLLSRAPQLGLVVMHSLGSLPSPDTNRPRGKSEAASYLAALALVLLATGAGFLLKDVFNPTNLVMIYLAAVVCSAYYYGRGASNLAAVLSVIAFDVFFVPPRFRFVVDEPEYIMTFLGLLLSGLLVAKLTAKAKEQALSARKREEEALALLAFNRDLSQVGTTEDILSVARDHLTRTFGANQIVLEGASLAPDGDEVERWYPISSSGKEKWGSLGLVHPFSVGDRRAEEFLEAFRSHLASALERQHLVRQAREAELLRASDKLHTALLNSISHDLRIPLVSIQGALTSLLEQDLELDEETRNLLIENALEESDRLNRLVGNLLQMTRLESGHLSVRKLPCDVEDLVSTTLSAASLRFAKREVKVELPQDLPLVPMDFVLIQQVLTNLLENAAKFSPSKSPIELQTRLSESSLVFEISDYGPGLPEESLERVFKRFERLHPEHPGTGLGLSICKGLVEAHGGTITAENRVSQGACFRVHLPLSEGTREAS